MTLFDDPLAFFVAWPALAVPAFVFFSAFLEYVVPPVPGDSCMLVGFFLAAQGACDPIVVFAAAFLGCLAGGAVSFRLGARYGDAVLQRVVWRRQRLAMSRFRALATQRGEAILAVNRFLPVVRSIMLYGAGAFGLDFKKSMAWNAASALAFVSLLFGAGWATAGSWNEIRERFSDMNRLAGGAALAAGLFWLAWMVWRSAQVRAATRSAESVTQS
ncbi:MAG: VTT domain-containing protein [Thermoanaerobaculia bacterium]|nr:VTT domain-containing protein [Thermoanaerobaculia bacterium]